MQPPASAAPPPSQKGEAEAHKRRRIPKPVLFAVAAAMVVIAAVFAFSVNGGKTETPLTAAQLLELGEKYLLELDYEQAIIYFEQLIEIEPRNARGYTGLAEAYIGLGDIDNAREALERGIDATGGDPEVQRALDELEAASVRNGVLDVPPPGAGDSFGDAPPSDTTATSTANTIVLRIGSPNMTVNGAETAIDASGSAPVISDGVSMIPLRGVLETMGGSVTYDDVVGSVKAEFGGHTALIAAENDMAYIEGEAARLPAAPMTRGGSLYVPARLFADAFGAELAWDGAARSVTLTYTGAAIDASSLPPALTPTPTAAEAEGANVDAGAQWEQAYREFLADYTGDEDFALFAVSLADINGDKQPELIINNHSGSTLGGYYLLYACNGGSAVPVRGSDGNIAQFGDTGISILRVSGADTPRFYVSKDLLLLDVPKASHGYVWQITDNSGVMVVQPRLSIYADDSKIDYSRIDYGIGEEAIFTDPQIEDLVIAEVFSDGSWQRIKASTYARLKGEMLANSVNVNFFEHEVTLYDDWFSIVWNEPKHISSSQIDELIFSWYYAQ
jgi:tetratricopeptide (TPR) repeat protein